MQELPSLRSLTIMLTTRNLETCVLTIYKGGSSGYGSLKLSVPGGSYVTLPLANTEIVSEDLIIMLRCLVSAVNKVVASGAVHVRRAKV